MGGKSITVSIVIDAKIEKRIEDFRKKQMNYVGNLSRSLAVRMLVSRGLEVVAEEEEILQKAKQRKRDRE